MRKKITVFITIPDNNLRAQLFLPETIDRLGEIAEFEFNPLDRELDEWEIITYGYEKDAIITGWGTHQITEKVIERLPKLKFIGHTAGSVSHLVTDDFFKHSIMLTNANEVLSSAVAEYCMMMTLVGFWEMIDIVNTVKEGNWRSNEDIVDGIGGKTIGIIGYGSISKEYIRLLATYDVKILVYSSHCSEITALEEGFQLADLEQVLGCDLVSLHSILNEHTYNMLGAKELSKIKDGAILINTARAGLIQEQALWNELQTGRFRAILDVFHQEPLQADNPLRNMKNVIITPHAAGTNRYWRSQQAKEVIRDMELYFTGGLPNNPIDLKQYKRMTVK